MTTPLFPRQPEVSRTDRKRLEPHLSGWNKLCALLESELVSEDDVKRLVLMEFSGLKRKRMVQKLLGYLAKLQRKRILSSLK